MSKSKFYLYNSSWIYISISIFMSFILLAPFFISLSESYYMVSRTTYFPQLYLGICIPILLISNIILVIFAYFHYKYLRYEFKSQLWLSKFTINLIVLASQSFLSFVAFMIIWSVPIDMQGDQNVILKEIANLRIILYGTTGFIITLLGLGLSLYSNLHMKYLIIYTKQKEKYESK